jgi:3',5'-cyclic AMP phosphodiesterase CpdA
MGRGHTEARRGEGEAPPHLPDGLLDHQQAVADVLTPRRLRRHQAGQLAGRRATITTPGAGSAGGRSMGSTTRVAWLTDLHLDFLVPAAVDAFGQAIAAAAPDAVLISGDIATAGTLEPALLALERHVQRPIYFVLGNHDFYGGSIAAGRAAAAAFSRRSRWLRWLPAAGVVALTASTGVVGHDGWADGRCGDYAHSDVLLSDYFYVEELVGLTREERLRVLHALGDEAAAHFRRVLPGALARYRRVLLVTHVPPFREACWHQGQLSDDAHLPHFACQAVGDALLQMMRNRPDRHLIVLCGHTHSPGVAQILPNLRVYTGGATYGRPDLQRLFAVGE